MHLVLLLVLIRQVTGNSFDPKIIGITNNCSENYNTTSGEILRYQNGTREYFKLETKHKFDEWLERVYNLPGTAHGIFSICNKNSLSEEENLVSLAVDLLLDSNYYVTENPGVVYKGTKRQTEITNWIKQTNIALVYTYLPRHVTILFSRITSFTKIPIIAKGSEKSFSSNHQGMIYPMTTFKSTFIEQVGLEAHWKEIIILHFIKRKPNRSDQVFIYWIAKTYNKDRQTCIKVVEIRLGRMKTWNKTFEVFKTKSNTTRVLFLIGRTSVFK